MALKLVTPPAVTPISLAEAKRHLVIDHNDDDDMITFMILVATQYLDAVSGWHGRSLITQTWDLVLDSFETEDSGSCCCPHVNPLSATQAAAAIQMPWPPLQSVTSIKYIDSDGVQQTMLPTDYFVDTVSIPGWVIPISGWPAAKAVANAIEIRFVCGYGGDGIDVDAPIRMALLLHVGHLYENREAVISNYTGSATAMTVPFGYDHLLSPTRQILV